MTMTKLALVGAAALLAALAAGSSAMAFGVQTVYEDNVAGYVGAIPTSSPPIMVASDGEASFDPFGAGYDTSDAIQLNSSWAPDPAYAKAFGADGWVQIPGTYTWVLPACNSTGCENANIYEPIAKWDFLGGGGWAPGTLSVRMLESDGSFSDMVTVANDGVGGAATITFQSGGVPEPATWAMMLVGFAGIGYAARRRLRAAVAI
ncbi:MAG: hypothetical protein JWO83_1051 [Caulobacteraceae bacterium]|jgi:hypothetical protein|nr:hypothetical protein [Caulobacteraceae bacterium]